LWKVEIKLVKTEWEIGTTFLAVYRLLVISEETINDLNDFFEKANKLRDTFLVHKWRSNKRLGDEDTRVLVDRQFPGNKIYHLRFLREEDKRLLISGEEITSFRKIS
jgi:hypothetical protein